MGLTKAVRNLFAVGCCIAEVQERPQALGNDRLVQRGHVVASQAMILRCTCPAVLKVAFVGEDLLPGSRAGDLLQSCWFSYEPCTISAAPRSLRAACSYPSLLLPSWRIAEPRTLPRLVRSSSNCPSFVAECLIVKQIS